MMNILIADDDDVSRRGIAEHLSQNGHGVLQAEDGIAAFTTIVEHPVNIAVIDWMLPGMEGPDLCRKIRENQKDHYVFIIVMTTGMEQRDILEVFAAGADEYLAKPVHLQELSARIQVRGRILGLEKALLEKQREMAVNQQMKNKFIGIVAHDLRNPLISIRGFSELLLKDAEQFSAEQREFLDIIHSTSRNMLAMINDLLDISRIESGSLNLDLKLGAMEHLITERLQIIRLQAAKKHITLHVNLSPIPDVLYDRHRMSQAVDNLITNAIKFSPRGANVYLTLQTAGERAKFSVADEGPGIPQEEQHLLFSEFHRLSVRPTAGEPSTGLGLVIAKRIIEAHNGEISFESREGVGSTFHLFIPLAASPSPK